MKIKKALLPLAIAMAFNAVGVNAATPAQHVVLISVDGLHQNDLDWFVKNNPASTLASLVNNGVQFANAMTPFPADSFPGLIGQITGGNPHSTGIYYDVSYNRDLLAPGTTDCVSATPGTIVAFDESIDKNPDRLDAGQNIPGLYDNVPSSYALIPALSGDPKTLINTASLPVDPGTCTPVYPHQYLKVNTVFNVAHQHHLRTAWSDKHPAYEIVNGRNDKGANEFFTPEINGLTVTGGSVDFTKNNIDTQTYDNLKVNAVLNWAKGKDHAGTSTVGVPAIYGLNFQSVSTAQKLNFSSYYDPSNPANIIPNGLGGYTIDAVSGKLVPGMVLSGALSFVDQSIGKIVDAVDANTVVIISAKHGQSPEDRSKLVIINDGDMLAALDAAWNTAHPGANGLVAHSLDDDGVLIWLKDRSKTATQFVKNFLMNYSGIGIGSDSLGNKTAVPFTNAGLSTVYAGHDAAKLFNVNWHNPRVPDVVGIAKEGSVYGGGKLSKIAEHGGMAENDRHVPIIVWGAGIASGKTVTNSVETTQIAPTILKTLGLDPSKLKAVKIEGTQALPQLN
ncbi:MAG: alkaline phosphatase family protein [Methylovulum sp.]|uniref:alkaline phosphatase family protein n=1 Tax=Methylovulum sp. TaxID=1916980 RepID=UPI00262F8246|nr:alkaline phosphatase family protein [Methylovulum sp.]MDD2722642.1 alkaline phosphatase family protein [Methylovulum sp.]MDD5123886.1 alkaline phosphatase family protein [Methylovulum sp.]